MNDQDLTFEAEQDSVHSSGDNMGSYGRAASKMNKKEKQR